MSENPPPGLDEIHGSLTAPLLPSLEGNEVLAAPVPDVPLRPTNPTLPTLDWNPTAPAGVVSTPPAPPAPAAAPPAAPAAPPAPPATPAEPLVDELSAPPPAFAAAAPLDPAVAAVPPLAPAPSPSAPSPSAPAEVGAPAAEAAGVPALPTVAPPAPAPPGAAGMTPASASPFDAPEAPPLETHRARDAVGGIVRTLVVAAVVAVAVFGGRYAFDWNEDRHSDPVAADVLPATPVPAVDARFVEFQGGSTPVTAHVDLATRDFVASISATTELARRGGEYWIRDGANDPWVPASAEFLDTVSTELETIDGASLVMISDVLPVGSHPYVTVTADETVTVPGSALQGPQVIVVGEPVTDADVTTPVAQQVLTRHLTVTVDRLALRAADPYLAESSRLSGSTPLVIDIWVDSAGVVRQMSSAAGASDLPSEYQLLSASVNGPGPLADLGLPPLPVAPTEEVAE